MLQTKVVEKIKTHSMFKPLNAELNPICHLLALLGAYHILHVGRKRVNSFFKKKYVEKCRARQAKDDSVSHAHCVLGI